MGGGVKRDSPDLRKDYSCLKEFIVVQNYLRISAVISVLLSNMLFA